MSNYIFLVQVAPSGTVIGAIVAVTFLLVFLAVAFVAWKALKKTAKMAFRLTVVGVILVIAVAGSASLWYLSSGGTPKLKPPVEKKR
jgi:hypothetical protein